MHESLLLTVLVDHVGGRILIGRKRTLPLDDPMGDGTTRN